MDSTETVILSHSRIQHKGIPVLFRKYTRLV